MLDNLYPVIVNFRGHRSPDTDNFSSVNGLDCFENLKKIVYFGRNVFRKVLKGSSASPSGIYRLDLHRMTK